MKSKIGIKSYKNENEHKVDEKLIDLFNNCPIPQNQILENLGLFLNAKNFSRILFMHHIYDKIKNIQGVIMDFGTRWGNNMALFSIFRGMYEPFNRHRKIIGFDTFSGFPSINKKDGKSDLMEEGNVATTKKYEVYLNQIMSVQEQQNPISHIKKYEICKGDASEKLKDYIDNNPETIIALAYFDFDIYEPTKNCLELIKPRLVKGSILGFDELNDPDSPGETIALMEVVGLNNIKLKRLPFVSRSSFFEVQ
ncbi:MAG: crotonobetainyl-CoA--carnitine CoA-transferase [Candidatus Marinimicrobia bacterium]|nr:crotonobetainyl-CoA--carnitine CoA-transferase [Candidatus Neomarinimicrobiota bacterium]|tara:strand:+ start:3009 stop:3764 length:756 start_codon:yes stop_codon:yes gene_type:complete